MQKAANDYSPKTWQPTVRERDPAGLGPLSRKPPRGQENSSPVFILILIHSRLFGAIQPLSSSRSLVFNLAVTGSPTRVPWGRNGWTVLVWCDQDQTLIDYMDNFSWLLMFSKINFEFYNYLVRTVAKEGCVRICVSLATLLVIPRVVEPFSIGCGLATVSMIVADLHHSAAITLTILDGARLDGNAGHPHT